MRRAVLAVATVVLAALAGRAAAGVSVVEDEVIFTFHSSKATDVYLVGDFNNWNPTVEPLEREGGAFRVSLFLVPGSYRYKFVVDGRWIVDPDNPGPPDRGSIFTIEERPGGYALSTDEPEPERRKPAVTPTARYIGNFRRDDDGHGESDQVADLFLSIERSHLRGSIDLRSFDDTWRGSTPAADIDVAGISVEASAGALSLRGFESDSTWTSRGPVTLVGDDGVFDYNAGLDRHGVALSLSPSETFLVRGQYTDYVGEDGGPAPVLDVASLGADTAAYAASPHIGGADQAAVEVAIDASDFDAGYVLRADRGLHPGLLVESDSTVYATRENRSVALYWARVDGLLGTRVTAGYGHGSADVRRLRRGRLATGAAEARASDATAGASGRVRLLSTDRVIVALEHDFAGLSCSASWDYTHFDLEPGALADATARVHRTRAGVAWTGGQWTAALRARLTDQDYGGAPGALQVDSPVLNPWLGGRDELTVADIAALGRDRYAQAALSLGWTAALAWPRWLPRRGRLDIDAMGRGAFDAVELVETQAGVGFEAPAGQLTCYAWLDGRIASYDRVSETFKTGWAEVGCRRGVVDVNVGYGFDPVVFDPVTGEYGDIGRVRFLREAVAAGIDRDRADETFARLVALERALESAGVIKLECVVRF